MPNKYLLVLNKSKRISELVFYLLIFIVSVQPMIDPDWGWHYQVGKYVWQYQDVPRVDWLSYSLPGHEFIAHSWLLDTILYQGYTLFGLMFPSFFYSGILLVAIICLRISTKLTQSGAVLWQWWLPYAWMCSQFLGARPQIVTFLGLGVLLSVIDYVAKTEAVKSTTTWVKTTYVWLLPLLFILWANLHAGFILGLGILVLWLGVFLVKSQTNKQLTWQQVFALTIIVGLCFLTTLINPYGIKLWKLILAMVTNSAAYHYNTDWLPLFSNRLPSDTLPLRLLLALLSIATLVIIKEVTFRKVLVTVFFILTLTSLRYSLPLLVTLAPLLIQSLNTISQSFQKQITNRLLLGGVGLWAGIVGLIQINNSVCASISPECLANLGDFPYRAVSYLKNSDISGNIFNHYSWGGYLDWQLPESKVFIDGRMDGFSYQGQNFAQTYANILESESTQSTIIEQTNTSIILLPPDWPITTQLLQQSIWQKVYEDPEAIILLRK